MKTSKDLRKAARLTACVGTPREYVDHVRDRDALEEHVKTRLGRALGYMAMERATVALFKSTELRVVESAAQVYAFSETELIEYTRAVRDEWIAELTGCPVLGKRVDYPTGRGTVVLPPDNNGIVIVSEAGVWKRIAANACTPVPQEEPPA